MSRDRQAAVWAAVLLVFLGLIYLLGNVLLPFVAGMAVAYFLDPLADKLQLWMRSRTLAVLIILGGFVLSLVIVVLLLLPVLQGQVLGFASRVPDYIASLKGTVQPLLEQLRMRIGAENAQDLLDTLAAEAGKGMQWMAGLLKKLVSGGVALLSLLSLIFITPLVSFYLLRDWDSLVARVDSWLPRRAAPTIRSLVSETDDMIAGFVRGQATVCLVLATLYAVGLSLVGLEFGLLVGLLAGLISFIPYVGTGVGLGTGMAIAMVQFSDITPIAMVALVFGIGQILEGYVLTPKLVGERVGLHPVWVIFALLAGGSLFGFTGMLLAVPGAAVIGVLVRFSLKRYLVSPLYEGGEGSP
ncbi:AI-2E family transporter [Magnetospira sp. QH-2]|uniref:AI-2E family transporter n=1 Tax=Magnetospira sp. (strain QH-2) TaxID=1288970 RepID=UPI0003E80FCA|nr:AI-2E family transporter [Magnetospira sp. QH-2]CCQ72849.1 putative permease [Magnetospira sp. QH-2]